MSTQEYKDIRINAAKKSIAAAEAKNTRAREAISAIQAAANKKIEIQRGIIEVADAEREIAIENLRWLEEMPVFG